MNIDKCTVEALKVLEQSERAGVKVEHKVISKKSKIIAITAAFAIMMSATSIAANAANPAPITSETVAEAQVNDVYVYTRDYVNVRSTADFTDNILYTLEPKTKVKLLGVDGDGGGVLVGGVAQLPQIAGIAVALLGHQGRHQIPVCSFGAARRKAACQYDHIAFSGSLFRQFRKLSDHFSCQRGAGFIQFGYSLAVKTVYLHVGPDMSRHSQKMMSESFPVHHGSQVRRTVFPHNPDTLYIQSKSAGDDGNVDPLAAQINTGVPYSVHLACLKALNIDCFVKTGIQTNRCYHLFTPLSMIQIIISFPCPIRNRSICPRHNASPSFP